MTTKRGTRKSRHAPSDVVVPSAPVKPPDLRVASLVQKEGFAALAQASPPVRPDDLTIEAYRALSREARFDYDEQRRTYHANYGPIATPMLTTNTAVLEDVHDTNRYKRGDKLSTPIILSAPAGLGKSTMAVDFAQNIFRERRAERGNFTERGDEYIPAVYISLSSTPTARAIDVLICEYFGEPTRGAAIDLELRAHDCVENCRPELFVLDECQFIDEKKDWAPDSINHLKSLVNMMPGTFVFVGTGLSKDEALASRRLCADGKTPEAHDHMLLEQMERRWIPLTFGGFTLKTIPARREWESVLLTIERDLVLCQKHQGMLAIELSEYLFARSSGHIASLMSLITRGAHRAMKCGEEKLSKDLLDKVKIDAEAERQREAYVTQFASGQLSVLPEP